MTGKKRLWTVNFVLITMINLLMFLSFQMFPSTLPPYVKSLGAPDSVLGWITGITTVATLLIRPFTGIMLDKLGRRGIFITGLAAMAVSTAAYGIYPAVGFILAIRFIHGIAWGAASTACSTIASDNIERTRFGEGMGFFSLSGSLSIAIAPAIALSMDLKTAVWIAVGFMVLALALTVPMKYRSKPEGGAVKRGAPYERASIFPSAIVFLFMTSHGAILTFLAIYGGQAGIANVGPFFTLYALSMVVTRPPLGRLVDRFGYGAGVWPGVVLVPASLLILSASETLPAFLFCAVLFGIGMGAAQTSLQTMAVANAPEGRTGAANATFFTGFDGGIGFGAVVSGLLSLALGTGNMFAVLAALPILAGILYFIIPRLSRKKG